jgi:hypothetical protein
VCENVFFRLSVRCRKSGRRLCLSFIIHQFEDTDELNIDQSLRPVVKEKGSTFANGEIPRESPSGVVRPGGAVVLKRLRTFTDECVRVCCVCLRMLRRRVNCQLESMKETVCALTFARSVRAPYVSDRAISGPMDTDDLLKSLVREISPWSISKGK